MKRMLLLLELGLFFLFSANAFCDEKYRLPPPEIAKLIDAPSTPMVSISPRGDHMLIIQTRDMPTITELAKPFLRLAGLRFYPDTNAKQRMSFISGVKTLFLGNGGVTDFQLPASSSWGLPIWSPDGKKVAISKITEKCTEVWVFNPLEGTGEKIATGTINTVLLSPYHWDRDSKNLIIPFVPNNRSDPPKVEPVPNGPMVRETTGKISKLRTYEDLIQSDHDEEVFAYYAISQFKKVNIETKETIELGKPDFYSYFSISPDKNFILVQKLKRPFSKIVPSELFANSWEIWDSKGNFIRTIADLPAAEQLPIEGVPLGPRDIGWQQLASATLIWTEALDGGDPNNVVDFREKLFKLQEPFTASPTEFFKLPQRFAGLDWLEQPGQLLVSDFDRDKKWLQTWLLDLNQQQNASTAPLIFDRSADDSYNNPGEPVKKELPDGQEVAIASGNSIFLSGNGATPVGQRPFLRLFNLSDKSTKEIFRAATDTYEAFEGFSDEQRRAIITLRENPTLPPNYYNRTLVGNNVEEPFAITHFSDPAPELTKIKKELLTYKRKDGIPLSGTLYYPIDYTPGSKVPVIIWAYPREYTNPKTAGQVRTTSNRFTRPEGCSILFLVLHGYAVLYQAELPVVGPPKTANDTFVEQITDGAKAAIDKLMEVGICDPERVGVSGHSYGAFMTANLLAHTDLFAAGVARSGAYNRTLTPFGFQGERRSYWDAVDVYTKLSPFTHANKIKNPLLLIHGELDDNPGTFPMQSERMFSAIQGYGGIARLVILPLERHGYYARESAMQCVAETIAWFDMYVKNRKIAGGKN
ncbi:MAG: prolyl oligopeptidase family serine peptidase [Candidatus Riflebacteria bacterium]|nr:prolyl oligopeptidase family serine peptidase [Candidatus Riflebacteria bacterium]